MKKIYFSLLLIFATTTFFAQIPAGYYDSADGLTGEDLREALRSIITSGHSPNDYDDLYDYYESTDNYGSNKVWDMYSIHCDGTANYWFYFNSGNECGTYSNEGDCYNREHSVPQSWFDSNSPMVADLFIVYPTDGKVNGMRSNYPYGETDNPTWTSTNGSKVGNCSFSGYTGKIFEPADCYKGDFARTYFYVATRYKNQVEDWDGNATVVFNGNNLSDFARNLFLQWNAQDPVSQKEIDRNNAVYDIQGNRNPYIDHPEWVECVWNNNCTGTVEDPDNLTATGVTTSEIDLTWNLNTDNDDVLLAYNTTNSFGTPSGTYTAGDAISGGGTVLDVGNNTSFNHTGLSSQIYYYKLWSYDGTDYSSGITTSATPLVGEPSNHVTNFTVSGTGATTIDLTWTDATGTVIPSGYLIKANLSGSAINPPVDGQPEADATFVKNVSAGAEAVTFSGLNSNTAYDFEIFPYTNSGSSIDYKTDGTIPFISGSTTNTPVEIINEDFTTCPASDWITYSVAGNKDWQCGSNDDMYVNAYNGDIASDDWFISPAINFNNYTNETLSFNTYTKYSDGGITDPEVRLFYSTDYSGSGDPGTANWTEISYTFPAEDSQTWTASGNIDLSAINSTSGYIAFQYISSGTGGGTAALWELDDILLTGIQSSGGNTLPEFTSTPVTEATAGQIYNYDITATDGDGDNLSFSATTIPAWLNFTDNGDGTATLNGTPQNSDAGNNLVSISVSDGTGSVNQDFTIIVTAVNTLPEFTSTPVTEATAGQIYNYDITATDADGDNLSFSATTIPAWLNFTDNGDGTATLTGTPQNSDAGDNLVSISVFDGTGSVNQDFTIVVTSTESVNSNSSYNIKIFPNPAENSVNISSTNTIKTVKLKNILGKTVLLKKDIETNSINLNINSLSKGIYFIEITETGQNSILKKLIIE